MRITPKIGTTEYMAPEAFAGRINAALADRSDMWSMGVVLHVIFMGHFPSPRLAEQTPEEYLSASCWSRVSGAGRDLLGQLLRYDPARRPTVTVAMKHPWLNAALCTGKLDMVHPVSGAVRVFAASPGMRRLALAAAAREIDDCDLQYMRALFQCLELECDGALTRAALDKVACVPSVVGAIATELTRCFDSIDTDGSGTIDWTELVAVSLGVSGDSVAAGREEADAVNTHDNIDIDRSKAGLGLPRLQSDVCWRAFDLLSQGGEAVTGRTLGQLFVPTEVDGWLASNANTGGGTGGSDDGMGQSYRISELDMLIKQVDPRGELDSNVFQRMLVTPPWQVLSGGQSPK